LLEEGGRQYDERQSVKDHKEQLLLDISEAEDRVTTRFANALE
jgi:hypothetical protein